MPILGRLIKLTEIIAIKDLKSCYEKMFIEKLGEEITEESLKAIEEGYYEL